MPRKTKALLVLSFLAVAFFLCTCGSGGTSNTVTNVDANSLDGATDVDVNGIFTYTFSKAVNETTLTTSTVFVVPISSGASLSKSYIPSTCMASSAISATVSSTSSHVTLTPASPLSVSTCYGFCMVPGTETPGITMADGTNFEGFLATFTTAATAGGGSSSPPSVLSIVDTDSTTLQETRSGVTATGINPTSFEINFSQTMDYTSLSTPGNIVITCGSLTPTLSFPEPRNGYVGAIEVADAWKYAMMDCALTITTNVKNSSGVAFASADTYAFKNKCAVNDDFNAQTISDDSTTCWTISNARGTTLTTWASMANVVSFGVANSSLDAAFTDQQRVLFSKEVVVGSDDVEVEMYVPSSSGWDSASSTFSVNLAHEQFTSYEYAADTYYEIGIGGFFVNGSTKTCCYARANKPGEYLSLYVAECNEPNTGYYVKLAKSGTAVSKLYKREGGEYHDVDTTLIESWPRWSDDFDLTSGSGSRYLNLLFAPESGSSQNAAIGHVKVNDITIRTQY